MFLGLAIVLFVIWVLCVLVFKIAAGAIHLIVVIDVIAFIVTRPRHVAVNEVLVRPTEQE